MAEKTEISWTDATFNPWMGCTKVGPGCDHCYAEELMDKRYGKVIWGVGAERVRTGEKNWNLPKRWNARAFFECQTCHWRGEMKFGPEHAEPGKLAYFGCTQPGCGGDLHETRRRVFCSSLADVFDNAVDPQWRVDLFALIRATPNLDWLLLTKRIGNAHKMIDESLIRSADLWRSWPWPNVWLGATIVNQEEADRDIPKLLAVPARVRFLSMEPLLGPVSLTDMQVSRGFILDALTGVGVDTEAPKRWQEFDQGISWVIVGGESGKEARPMRLDWVTSLRDQCEAAGVAFHFKQWGEWAPGVGLGRGPTVCLDRLGRPINPEGKGPVDRLFCAMHHAGKKAAGRELDGRTHNEFPRVTP